MNPLRRAGRPHSGTLAPGWTQTYSPRANPWTFRTSLFVFEATAITVVAGKDRLTGDGVFHSQPVEWMGLGPTKGPQVDNPASGDTICQSSFTAYGSVDPDTPIVSPTNMKNNGAGKDPTSFAVTSLTNDGEGLWFATFTNITTSGGPHLRSYG